MKFDHSTLPDNPEELKRLLVETERRYEKENTLLREQISLLYAQLFGKKSEKCPGEPQGTPLPLFDMPEPEEMSAEEPVQVEPHIRKKSGRKPLPEALPRVDVVHDIPEEEKSCGCGAPLQKIGEDISEKLDIIPAVIRVIRHIRPKYACRACEGIETEGGTVKIALAPKQIISKGVATAGLLAHVLTAKFCDALPFYRQERQFERLGVTISRSTMCNWAIKAATACEPLLELIQKEIRSGPLINIDETTVQVLKETGRQPETTSYMWVCRGGSPESPVLRYYYSPSRSGKVAEDLLAGFKGVVQSDGYKAYNFLDNSETIVHAGCWAHTRRKFMDAKKGQGKNKKSGSVDIALNFIQKLYGFEKDAAQKELSGESLVSFRRKNAGRVLDDFLVWLEKRKLQVTPKSLLGNAINYTLNQWQRLIVYLDHAAMTPDNNLAENAIRPFVVGRKNWLFAGTAAGAEASAKLYSLIESAKACGIEPYRYLRYIFEKLPFATSSEDYAKLLPARLKEQDLTISCDATGV